VRRVKKGLTAEQARIMAEMFQARRSAEDIAAAIGLPVARVQALLYPTFARSPAPPRRYGRRAPWRR
jgi:hypothetical protein